MKSIAIAAACLAADVTQGAGAGYDYSDFGKSWADSHEMCARPDNSPINIQTNSAIFDSSICEPALNWDLDMTVHDWSVKNVGLSLAVTPLARIDQNPELEVETTLEDDSQRSYTTRTTKTNSIARLPNNFLPTNSRNEEFCLHSFHFHWGWNDKVGSEHLLNDEAFPLEVHFVHYSCNRENIGEALGPYGSGADIDAKKAANGDPYELAVVGIFLEAKEFDNPAFEAILSQDVLDEIQYGGEVVINNLFLQDLVPEGVWTDGYYAYEGSLTTPPCTSIVRWHVMNALSYIGTAQLERFRQMMQTNSTGMTPNFRQVVENENPLYACMDASPTTSEETSEKVESSEEEDYTWVWALCVFGCVVAIAAAFCYYVRVNASNSRGTQSQMGKQQELASVGHVGNNRGDEKPVTNV